ncbi:MAG: MFS transporter permease [Dehalococcoidia bacterium]|nr:MFS transporter permease [Dehalococcoidia bacterium]
MKRDLKPSRSTIILRATKGLFSFPHPVNEMAARWVASMVMVLSITIILTDLYWLGFFLTYGFLARVLTGPKLSPMGLIATRILVPRFGNIQKLVAGPPKRFAQSIGLFLSIIFLILIYILGLTGPAKVILATIGLFAGLECVLGFCAGCVIFGYLIKCGLIPEATCKRCADFRFNL